MKEEEGCVTPVADLACGVWEYTARGYSAQHHLVCSELIDWLSGLRLHVESFEMWDAASELWVGQKCYEASGCWWMQTGLTVIQQTAQPLESVLLREREHAWRSEDDLLKKIHDILASRYSINNNNNNNRGHLWLILPYYYHIIITFQIITFSIWK